MVHDSETPYTFDQGSLLFHVHTGDAKDECRAEGLSKTNLETSQSMEPTSSSVVQEEHHTKCSSEVQERLPEKEHRLPPQMSLIYSNQTCGTAMNKEPINIHQLQVFYLLTEPFKYCMVVPF